MPNINAISISIITRKHVLRFITVVALISIIFKNSRPNEGNLRTYLAAETFDNRRSFNQADVSTSLPSPVSIPLARPLRPLTFVTLIFSDFDNRASFEANIEHNCRLILDAPGGHKLYVYTDNPEMPYCKKCKCFRFTRYNCPCPPQSTQCGSWPSFCEKLHFVKDRIYELGEFVFMDRDFIILYESFIERLYARTLVHDLLISYDHTYYKYPTFRKQINTGFFIRKMPNINYTKVIDKYYELGNNDDQPAFGHLMFDNYTNFEILNHGFHCRLVSEIIEFPPERCLALHDRGGELKHFRATDYKMRRLNGSRYYKFRKDGSMQV